MSVSPRFYLFKRSNGVYYILIDRDGDRRWRSTGAKLKSEALKALREFEEHHELQADTPKWPGTSCCPDGAGQAMVRNRQRHRKSTHWS